MGGRHTRAESKAANRSRLLAAGRTVFLRRGYHGATLEAVAEAAGLTKGAVYSSFASKADVFLALLDELLEQRVNQMTEALANEDTLAGQLSALARHYTLRRREEREWTLVLIEFWASAGRDPKLRRQFGARHERLLGALATLQEKAASEVGEQLPAPALDLVRAWSAMGHGMALEWLVSPEAVSDDLLGWMFARLAPGQGTVDPGADGRSRGAARRPGSTERARRSGP